MKHLGEDLALVDCLWGLLISLLKFQTVLFEILSLIYIGLAKRKNSPSVLPHLEIQIPFLSSQISLNPHSKPKCLNFVQHKYNYNYMSLKLTCISRCHVHYYT